MLKVTKNAAGLRLDRWLTEVYPEHSRSYWQKEIKAGRVLVRGQVVSAHYALREGETIEVVEVTKVTEVAEVAEEGSIPKLDIIAEEKDFLVVNKPAGLLVHPTDSSRAPTLVDALLAHDPSIAEIGDPKRPGIVHRLDRETSGIMVVARTQAMYEHLKRQFALRTVQKEYIALTHGQLRKDEGEVTFTIARSQRGGRMAARPANGDGRIARTRYEVIQRFPTMTLVRVFPLSGRTHQIRAHFLALGHPIVGDPLYRTKALRRKKSDGRLMLHAAKLTFTDPTGREHAFEAPLPQEFATYFR